MTRVNLIACACALVVLSVVGAEEKYTTRFDNVNVDDILKSDRLLNNYAQCILDKGRCTPEGKELKSHIPEAMTDGCTKCSEKQKEIGNKILTFMFNKRRPLFDEIATKYDPTGVFRKKYEKTLPLFQ